MASGDSVEAAGQIKMNSNYLLMDKEDLLKSGIRGKRLKLTTFLSSKGYDIGQIILICVYCLLMIITFIADDFL